jgi:hypothetical protein
MLSSASTWPVTQPLFAFELEDPHTGRKTNGLDQAAQGFENSPTLFREALTAHLSTFLDENTSCTLLKYVDDLLLASHN